MSAAICMPSSSWSTRQACGYKGQIHTLPVTSRSFSTSCALVSPFLGLWKGLEAWPGTQRVLIEYWHSWLLLNLGIWYCDLGVCSQASLFAFLSLSPWMKIYSFCSPVGKQKKLWC